MKVRYTTAVLTAALTLTACGVNRQVVPPPPQTICGTIQNPTRVVDDDCRIGRPDVRWYSADPAGLDADDFTEIGEKIDDDYLVKRENRSVRTSIKSLTKKTTTSKTTKKSTR